MKTILLFVSILCSSLIYGQDSSVDGVPEKGTYQIIVKESKVKLVFTIEILKGMEEKRKKNESVSIQLAENVFLYLPSSSSIKNTEFIKLEAVLYE